MYCSPIQSGKRAISALSCKAVGIPVANISIYIESTSGIMRILPSIIQKEDELVIVVPILMYGEVISLHCVASNIVSTVILTINLTYTCK